jgi:transcriptional regulator with XRE-family HTH domain
MTDDKVHMTPAEARAIREQLGWTLEETARNLGVGGGRSNYFQFEMDPPLRRFTFAQAQLMRAYAAGYTLNGSRISFVGLKGDG